MSDPFLIHGPAIISFSGGRTSAYMLWRILQAHGGTLPPGVHVVFANTGPEMPATLDFVRDCETHWGVPIVWLEYCRDPATRRIRAEVVGHNSASRAGEPFEAMLGAKNMLPNPVTRFCTTELKIRTVKRWVREVLGWDRWVNVVGLRADEPGRVERMERGNAARKERFTTTAPLSEARVEEIDVLRFWRAQPFDLRLRGRHEGNCDGCFLKARGAISRMWADYPDRMQWWADMETKKVGIAKPSAARFRADREQYAVLGALTKAQGILPLDLEDQAVPCDAAVCGV